MWHSSIPFVRRPTMFTLPLILGLTALANSTPPSSGTPSLADDLLRATPQDAVVVFTVRDLDGLRERAAANAWGRFFADPQMKLLCAHLEQQGFSWDKLIEESELPFDPLDVLRSIHDSATFFVAPVGPGLEPGFGMLIAPGDESGAFEEHFDNVLDLIGGELVATSASYAEVDLTIFEGEDDEPDLITFERGGMVALVGSSDRESGLLLAHGVLDRFLENDDSQGLAKAELLSEARASVRGQKSLEFLLDVGSVLRLIGAHEDDPDFDKGYEVMERIGITQMRYVYMNADIGSGESVDVNFSMHVPADTYLARYLDLFGPYPKELDKLMPADATSIMLGEYDLYGAWGVTMGLMQEYAPEAFEQVQGGLQMAVSSTGLDIEQDLLAQISGSWGSFTIAVPEEEVETAMGPLTQMGMSIKGFDQGNASVIGLEDADVVELFLEDAMNLGGMWSMVEQEEFQGELISSFSMPGAMSLHWAFVDGALLFSEYPTALRSALRLIGQEDAATALTTQPFQGRASGQADAAMIGVHDTAETVRMMLAIGGMLRDGAATLFDGPDLSELPLPGTELAAKYFEGTWLSTVKRAKNSFVWSNAGR